MKIGEKEVIVFEIQATLVIGVDVVYWRSEIYKVIVQFCSSYFNPAFLFYFLFSLQAHNI